MKRIKTNILYRRKQRWIVEVLPLIFKKTCRKISGLAFIAMWRKQYGRYLQLEESDAKESSLARQVMKEEYRASLSKYPLMNINDFLLFLSQPDIESHAGQRNDLCSFEKRRAGNKSRIILPVLFPALRFSKLHRSYRCPGEINIRLARAKSKKSFIFMSDILIMMPRNSSFIIALPMRLLHRILQPVDIVILLTPHWR